MTRSRGWALALATVGGVVAIDQMTKAWVRATMAPHEKINVFFALDITNVKNTGVAFGALSGSGGLVFIAVLVAMGGLLVYFTRHIGDRGLWLPVGMVFGGALGNLADHTSVQFVYQVTAFLPLLGVVGLFLPTSKREVGVSPSQA